MRLQSFPRLSRALACALLAACGGDAPGRTPADGTDARGHSGAAGRGAPRPDTAVVAASGRDDFGAPVTRGARPARIVSLNPTTTELLFAIGAGDRLVGRSRWDEWPDAARRVPSVGDGLRPNVEAVLAARPDLVVLYASGDNRAAADAFRAAGIATVALRIDAIADFRRAARLLGALTGDTAAARAVVDSVDASLARVRAAVAGRPRPRVVWPLFGRPLLVTGGTGFMHELIVAAGGDNIFADVPTPGTPVSREEILRRGADVVLVGGARWAAELRGDPQWAALSAVRTGRVHVVTTAIALRPSVGLGAAAAHLATLLHPDATGAPAPTR